MSYQPQSEHHRQYERTYRLGMHGGWTQGAKYTKLFLIIIAAVWVAALLLLRLTPAIAVIIDGMLLQPSDVVRGHVWQLFTAQWIGSVAGCQFWIVLFHLFYLLVFGPKVEREWGSPRFLRFYLLVAFIAALLACLLRLPTPFAVVPASTMSAAIFAIMVVYAANWPRDPVWIFGLFPTPILYVVICLCALEVLFMILAPAGEFGVDYVASGMGVMIGFASVKVPFVKAVLIGEKTKKKVSAGGRVRTSEFRKKPRPLKRNQPPFPSSEDVSEPDATFADKSGPARKPSQKPDEKNGKRSGFLEF